jgi:hypothetical protein
MLKLGLEERVGQLVLAARIEARHHALGQPAGAGRIKDQLAIGPQPQQGLGRAGAEGDRERGEVAVGDRGLALAALADPARSTGLDLLEARAPDDVAAGADGAEAAGNGEAVGRGGDRQIAQARPPLLGQAGAEQHAAQRAAGEKAEVRAGGAADRKAKRGAGSTKRELRHQTGSGAARLGKR